MNEPLSLRIFEAEFVRLSAEWSGKNHINSFWRLYFNDAPGAMVQSGGILYRIEAGRLFLLPAGVRFDYGAERLGGAYPRHFYVHFDVPGLAGFRLREAFETPILLPPHPALENESMALRDRLTPDFAIDLKLQSLVFGALGLAWDKLPTDSRAKGALLTGQHQLIVPALHHIEAHLGEPLRNEALAALCHLSRDHFIRCFKVATNDSPQNYVLDRRVALAAQKLLFTSDSIEKIAADCGFANRFYFSRMFARVMGISPAAFRRSARK